MTTDAVTSDPDPLDGSLDPLYTPELAALEDGTDDDPEDNQDAS